MPVICFGHIRRNIKNVTSLSIAEKEIAELLKRQKETKKAQEQASPKDSSLDEEK